MTRPTTPCLVALSVALAGCYTTRNVVSVPPLETRYPVSASPQFVSTSGEIVTDEHYSVTRSFAFEKTMDAPRHDSREAALRLESDLDRLVAEGQGEAVTNLRIEATEYDAGSHGSAAGLKIVGWTFSITGGAFLGVGLGANNETLEQMLVPAGAVSLGVGLLGFLLGATADEPAKWHLRVTGDVVQSSSPPAAQPASAPPPALPAPPLAPVPAPAPAPAPPASAPGTPAATFPPTEEPVPASPHGF